jgi:hypothetical protein
MRQAPEEDTVAMRLEQQVYLQKSRMPCSVQINLPHDSRDRSLKLLLEFSAI